MKCTTVTYWCSVWVYHIIYKVTAKVCHTFVKVKDCTNMQITFIIGSSSSFISIGTRLKGYTAVLALGTAMLDVEQLMDGFPSKFVKTFMVPRG